MLNHELVGLLIFASLIGSLIYAGLKKITPLYRELFFFIIMIGVNVITGIIALFVGAMSVQTGGTTGSLLVVITIEAIPVLLFILSFILLVRKCNKI